MAPSLIYFVKSKANQKKRKARRALAEETSRQAGAINPLELIIRVKDLARELGGMK